MACKDCVKREKDKKKLGKDLAEAFGAISWILIFGCAWIGSVYLYLIAKAFPLAMLGVTASWILMMLSGYVYFKFFEKKKGGKK